LTSGHTSPTARAAPVVDGIDDWMLLSEPPAEG